MAEITFFPLGNADTTLILLNDSRIILVDYCNKKLIDSDKWINLEDELRKTLKKAKKVYIDMVAFTHADEDHIHGADHIFWMEHSTTLQSDDRIKVNTLALPAAFILETGLSGVAKLIQKESRYRLRNGKGIIVFGEPNKLDNWLIAQNIDPKDRQNLFVKAGSCIPGYDKQHGEVEIFVHSPFSYNMEGEDFERNSNCLITQVTFWDQGYSQKLILSGDGSYEDWLNIIYSTKKNNNEMRLDWDLFQLSHHCSYTALSAVKGEKITEPEPEIDNMYLKGSNNCYIVSPSEKIPTEDSDQPPHYQAAAYYKQIARKKGGEGNFIVTMDWPRNSDSPGPLIILTSPNGFWISRTPPSIGIDKVYTEPSPRMG